MIDKQTELSFILLSATLDNGYQLYIRVAIASIQESAQIANKFLMIIGFFTIIISGMIVLVISRKFTSPIEELSKITSKIAELDFSYKYDVTESEDEINNLGRNINTMSETLEKTIRRLRSSNIELEKDIEEKSKTDEMRKQFISDVSHELKTPIALIQGYAEGLVENVIEDEESKKFYAEVILDESNKMDILVKKLLELMKLEYGKNSLNYTRFNISELICEVIRKSTKMIEEENIKVNFNNEAIYIIADEFYTEQVFNNYFTNAIKNIAEIDKKKEINISYEKGGTGIGLALVKAIMINTGNKYGVENQIDGVEFYFDVDLSKN